MSVINNVLKDLETRESCFSPIEIDSLAPPSAARRDVKKPALALFVIGLLTAAGWIYLQPQPVANLAAPATPKPADTATAISAEQAVAVITAPVAAPATPKPADTATAISVEQAAAVNTAPVAAPVPTAEPANAATEQTTGNQIVGLQIRESEQGMRFEFVLRARGGVFEAAQRKQLCLSPGRNREPDCGAGDFRQSLDYRTCDHPGGAGRGYPL